VRWGLAVLALGCGPLLLVALAGGLGLVDDPNPIGLGMLAFASVWPGVGMLVAGGLVLLLDWLR
jgi:hypothetical protein